jgi:pyruvate dehydrogenase E2 component (dihydrolipoamide acetyltransferase)
VLREVRVPDIGDFKGVPIIQILVAVGDTIKAEDPLVVLESDKATIEVPSPMAGVVRTLEATVGDRISKGGLLLSLEDGEASRGDTQTLEGPVAAPVPARTEPARAAQAVTAATLQPEPAPAMRAAPSSAAPRELAPVIAASADASKVVNFGAAASGTNTRIHAGPSIRALARRLGVDLTKVRGSGRTRRIMAEDVHAYVKAVIEAPMPVEAPSAQAQERPPAPRVDFARYGPVERHPLSRIQKISGSRLADNWARIPHVTQLR